MSVIKILILSLLISVFGAGSLCAEKQSNKRTPRVDINQYRQMERVRRGVRSGVLTKEDARALLEEQRKLRQMKRQARADGVVTSEERRAIKEKIEKENMAIDGKYRIKRKAE